MTPPQTYHRKPVQVEAMRYAEDGSNCAEVCAWLDLGPHAACEPHVISGRRASGKWIVVDVGEWIVRDGDACLVYCDSDFTRLYTPTPALPEERVVEAVKALRLLKPKVESELRSCERLAKKAAGRDVFCERGNLGTAERLREIVAAADAALSKFPEVTDGK